MAKNAAAYAVLSHYPAAFQPEKLEYLAGAGGFSGAEFWRFSTAEGKFCLRCWPPEHPDEDRLRLIHAVLRHAGSRGLDFVPLPVATVHGESFVRWDDRFWELTPWMPGKADYEDFPTPTKLRAAFVALAQFHSVVHDFPHPMVGHGCSPGLASRLKMLQELNSGGAKLVSEAVTRCPKAHPLRPMSEAILAAFFKLSPRLQGELHAHIQQETQLQPAIRDIWSQHVLFEGNRVTGIVDFGALNIDTPAGDIARLLGSMAVDDESKWRVGLEAYDSIRRLTPTEKQLITVFDRSSVLLSGLNWLRWIFVENRQFDDLHIIARRLQVTIARLKHLTDRWEEDAFNRP